jgi:hypothetical protein
VGMLILLNGHTIRWNIPQFPRGLHTAPPWLTSCVLQMHWWGAT